MGYLGLMTYSVLMAVAFGMMVGGEESTPRGLKEWAIFWSFILLAPLTVPFVLGASFGRDF